MPPLNDRVIAEIVAKIHASGSVETGLMASGIEPGTFRRWLEEASGPGPDPLVIRLQQAVSEAEADMKMLRENQLAKYFDKNWQALAWWLERKYPNEYGPKVKAGDVTPAVARVAERDEMETLLDLLPG